MLTFKQIQEKKTKIKINPNVKDQYEETTCPTCGKKNCTEHKVDEAQSSYDKARKAAARRAADRNAQRRAGKLGGRMERESYTSEAGTRMHYKGYKANANEEVEHDLEEERSARKMNVRTKGSIKKQIAKDAAAEAKRKEKKTGEYKETPKKRPSLKKPSQLTKVTGSPEPKKEAPKPKAKAKPKAKPVAAVKKVTPKAKPVAKKAAPKAKPVAKKAAPKAKPAPKAKAAPKPKAAPKAKKSSSLSDKAKDWVKRGVKRHRKATQGARVFAKGAAKGAKDTVKFAGKVKKVFTGEEFLSFSAYLSEATRLKKEKGYDKGGTKKAPSGAMAAVIAKIEKEHGKGAIAGRTQQKKKVKGAKSTEGTGKYLKRAKEKAAYSAKAKKAGFKSTQSYTDTMARYGGEGNYKKGRGLGS